jgi:glucose/arabinose dehydrogenase
MKHRVGFRRSRGANIPIAFVECLERRELLSSDVLRTSQTVSEPAASSDLAIIVRPSVRRTDPRDGAQHVDPGADIVAYVNLPNAGIANDRVVLNQSVRLYRVGDSATIPASVNTTAGGDAIVLTPLSYLLPHTQYRFEVTPNLKDDLGSTFQPYAMTFTTGKLPSPPPIDIAFTKVPLPTTTGRPYTGITIGPDDHVYAGTFDGEIVRFDVGADGTLGQAVVLKTIVAHNDGAERIITGLRFDPSSTAANLVLWVTHGHDAEFNAPDWSGKLSRLSGADLSNYEDYVTGLPRSVRDHLTQQMDFGPDGMLYVSQGSNNAMGAPDAAWGRRDERLLTAAILRLDTTAVARHMAAVGGPLDVRTEDGGNYDPYAQDAAVSLYATGVRNSFDILWHSNGHLYAPTNGSAPGGNAPADGGVPELRNIDQAEPDWLFDIKRGRYYGHPNPTRGEYVLDGGNPTDGADPQEIGDYPVGIHPDPDWDQAAFTFGNSRAPTGIIEYKSETFESRLKGSLIVCEYSRGNDLVIVTPAGDGRFSAGEQGGRGLPGTTGLIDPVDIVEHVGPGNLYITEFGGERITLLWPGSQPAQRRRLVFNDIVGGPPSPLRKATIAISGSEAVTFTELTVTGPDASMFRVANAPAMQLTMGPNDRADVWVAFDPPKGTALGLRTATLRIIPADPEKAPFEVFLRGLATAAETGEAEPSLQRVLDLFELPIEVGDADPFTSDMPLPLEEPNDAVAIERLVKAGDGPVAVDVLAVFASEASPTIRFGYYNPVDGARSEVLTVNESQRTRPNVDGQLTFDPGLAAFGLYSTAPARDFTAYTEDGRNTFEPVVEHRRKALFFPLTAWDGQPVSEAYVVAFEEVYGSYDFQDFVAVVRNVRPAPPLAPELSVLTDGVEAHSGENISFGEVEQGGTRPARTITLRNGGNTELVIGDVTLPNGFEMANPLSSSTIAAGATTSFQVAMSTTSAGAQSGPLILASNDADEGWFTLQLSGSVRLLPLQPPMPPVVITNVWVVQKRNRTLIKVAIENTLNIRFVGQVTLVVSSPQDGLGLIRTEYDRPTPRTIKLRPHGKKTLTLSAPRVGLTPMRTPTVTIKIGDAVQTFLPGTGGIRPLRA